MKYLLLVVLLAGCPKKGADPAKPDEPKPADAGTDPTPDAAGPVAPKGAPQGSATPVANWCANRPEKAGPFILDAALAAQRHGTGAKTYADVEATKQQPIEVCGLDGVRKWMESTKCPDGSDGKQGGRFDSVGLGGRCNTMIERYKVGCPDGTLNIVFAVHFCGPGEVM